MSACFELFCVYTLLKTSEIRSHGSDKAHIAVEGGGAGGGREEGGSSCREMVGCRQL